MTNDEINAAIAEHCGWRNIKEIDFGTDPYIDGPDQMWVGIHPESDSDSDEYEVIPDYDKDLNLMHEAMKTLSEEQVEKVWETLCDMIPFNRHSFRNGLVFDAPAKVRAEAFLRVIGKWKE